MNRYADLTSEILGVSTGYEHGHEIIFARHKPEILCTVQDCNGGGSYFRNFYINDGTLHWFVTKTDFFQDKNYTDVKVGKFVWKRVRTHSDDP